MINKSIKFVDFYAICHKTLTELRKNKQLLNIKCDFMEFLDAFYKCAKQIELDYYHDFIIMCPKCFSTNIEEVVLNTEKVNRCLDCKYETVQYGD